MAERLLGSWHPHIVRRATHPAVMEATAPSRDRNSTGVSRFAGNLTARLPCPSLQARAGALGAGAN